MADIPQKEDVFSDDFSGGLQQDAPKEPDREKLRGFFRSPRFGWSDGLEEYGDDYRIYEKPSATAIAADIQRRSGTAERPVPDDQVVDISPTKPLVSCEPDSGINDGLDEAPLEVISRGHTLVVGEDPSLVMACGKRLSSRLTCLLLIDDPVCRPPLKIASNPQVLRGTDIRIEGCLGRFKVSACIQGKDTLLNRFLGDRAPDFDLVLDLRSPVELGYDVMPLGYYAPDGDERDLERILIEMPEMTGIFEKPRLVRYHADICAHGCSGRTACSRCLDVCPLDAIQGSGDKIRIDHPACVGCGLCSTVCPTGALRCLHTAADDLLVEIQGRLIESRFKGKSAPTLVFHASGPDNVSSDGYPDSLEEPLLFFPVAEIGAVGPEVWLGALAYGAGRVVLLPPQGYPSSMERTIAEQIEWTAAILTGIGLDPDRIRLDEAVPDGLLTSDTNERDRVPAEFAPFQSKRDLIRCSVAHLAATCPNTTQAVNLPAGAAFGGVVLKKEDCTLCMACAGVCPTSALCSAGDVPALHLKESECIQCGLCRQICPERALNLRPRMDWNHERSHLTQVLHAEKPLACIRCGKPFASPQLVEKVVSRLQGHWMYNETKEIRRLKMCRDCRVQDFFLNRERDGNL